MPLRLRDACRGLSVTDMGVHVSHWLSALLVRSEKLVGFGPAVALGVLGALLFASAQVPVSADEPTGGPERPAVQVSEAAAGRSEQAEPAVSEPRPAQSDAPTTSATALWP